MWYAVRKEEWADGHAKRVIARLEQDVFPRVGRMPIAEISPLSFGAVRRQNSS
jgi:hypothetical protein